MPNTVHNHELRSPIPGAKSAHLGRDRTSFRAFPRFLALSGDARIARNYVPESVGLEAIAYCEKMVGLLDLDDIEQAHDEAIRLTQIKFAKHFPMA